MNRCMTCHVRVILNASRAGSLPSTSGGLCNTPGYIGLHGRREPSCKIANSANTHHYNDVPHSLTIPGCSWHLPISPLSSITIIPIAANHATFGSIISILCVCEWEWPKLGTCCTVAVTLCSVVWSGQGLRVLATLGSTDMLQVEQVPLKAKPFVEALSIVRTAAGDGCQWMEHSKSAWGYWGGWSQHERRQVNGWWWEYKWKGVEGQRNKLKLNYGHVQVLENLFKSKCYLYEWWGDYTSGKPRCS